MAAARDGDRAAADALLRRHYDLVYAVCRRLTGNEADALDAAQDAMVAIIRGLAKFDGRAAFSTWAYRIATNACLDELRRRKRRADPGLPEFETADLGSAKVGGRPAVAVDAAVSDRVDIEAALAQLPEEFRAPVVLRDLVGMDYAEIAETLGIPPGTVRSRIARGRGRLADLLGNPTPPAERRNPAT